MKFLWRASFVACLLLTLLAWPALTPDALGAPSNQEGGATTAPLQPTPTPTVTPTPTRRIVTAVVGAAHPAVWNRMTNAQVGTLSPGDPVTITQRSSDDQWLYVIDPNGLRGWVSAGAVIRPDVTDLPAFDVAIDPATPTPTPTATPSSPAEEGEAESADAAESESAGALPATVATGRVALDGSRLNIRRGPGTTYAVSGKAQPRQALNVHGRDESGDWILVSLSDQSETTGWAAADYLEIADPGQELPVVEVNLPPVPADNQSANRPMAQSSSGRASPTGFSGKLVIQEKPGQSILTYDLATGRLAPLTHGQDPTISPDGRRVAFTRSGGEAGLYIVDIDGANERLIFGERHPIRSPKWSPDGKWIVFMRADEFLDCRRLPDGRCVTEEWLNAYKPWIDPSSLPREKEPELKLARVDNNGENYRDLASLKTAQAPDWNSNGIVYQSKAGIQITQDKPKADTELVTFDILRQYYHDPDWQPDGGRIVFQRREKSHWEIFAVNPDGSHLVALTRPHTALVDTLPSNVSPAWSPDGQNIVFLSNRTEDHEAGPWRVWVMDADGDHQRPLPIDLSFEYGFAAEQMLDWGP